MRRVFGLFPKLQEASVSEPFSRQPPVTRAVGRFFQGAMIDVLKSIS
jgi:hypothetical protein